MERHTAYECHNANHHKGCSRPGCQLMSCPACHKEMMDDHQIIAKQKDQITNSFLINRGFTIAKVKNNLHAEITQEMKDYEQKMADLFMAQLKDEGSC